jgi:hypothetical protein
MHNRLAVALLERYGVLGEMDDLQEAIEHHHPSLFACSGNPNRSASLNNLARALFIRFQVEQLGRSEDLEDAIMHRRGLASPIQL